MIDAYLDRLGVRPTKPSVDELVALHRAHVERIPYENIEIYRGQPPGIETDESLGWVARGRGGYCYQLNGAFATLLTALGYAVTWHVGGVHTAEEPVGATGNHLALTVSGLPSPECPEGIWFVDAGLGDALHEPLPLRTGSYRQGPFEYALEPSKIVEGGWHFTHAAGSSFAGMDFGPVADGVQAFAANHAYLSTSLESGFTRTLTIQRRDADGVDILRGCQMIRRSAEGKSVREVTSQAEWLAEIARFGLSLEGLDPNTLWAKVHADHEAWLASQVPEVR
ncbi:MAG: arylamine N-acetyltransferase [Hamadaea sp.]|uniref:arylamine N-acetyltransferase family protein n=1 Tax=Hamadaea sp. TaxID=2024425 RepID=UPI0018411D3D|nr:arylamine N-acetyltransferase [Hamadaea sp.]NUR72653.1 arylamine N-acetyltransferase [Hamadaea sp.]NUT19748.1 arylamine N-acetyltransferase [Hamadaea sp.]